MKPFSEPEKEKKDLKPQKEASPADFGERVCAHGSLL